MKEIEKIIYECEIKTQRSSGAGGQHVNKVETKVLIIFSIENSKILNQEQKELVYIKLKNRINKNNEILITAQKYKSQLKNKNLAKQKLVYLVSNALKVDKKRKKTSIPKTSKEKRLKLKKIHSEIKKNRGKVRF